MIGREFVRRWGCLILLLAIFGIRTSTARWRALEARTRRNWARFETSRAGRSAEQCIVAWSQVLAGSELHWEKRVRSKGGWRYRLAPRAGMTWPQVARLFETLVELPLDERLRLEALTLQPISASQRCGLEMALIEGGER